MAEIVLSARGITKEYPGTKALDNVDFDIEKGKVNVLIGENGAGKSTLMKMIAGIEAPTSGKIYMDGKEIVLKNTVDQRHYHCAGCHHRSVSGKAARQNGFDAAVSGDECVGISTVFLRRCVIISAKSFIKCGGRQTGGPCKLRS